METKKMVIGLFVSLPSGRRYAAETDAAFRGCEGDRFVGGLDGESESELIRFAKDGESLSGLLIK